MSIKESWDGFKWYVREGFRHDSIVLSRREYSVLKTLTALATKDNIFTEIGVHVGYYSIRMAKLYKHVHAVEPNPLSIEGLKRNMKLNNVTNITIHQVACGDYNGEGYLTLKETQSTLIPTHQTEEKIKVTVKKLDDLVEYTDVVKIDVEGFEEKVIKGGLNLIYTCKPTIIIEHHHNVDKEAFNNIKKMLKEYRRFNLDNNRWCYVHNDKLTKINKDALKMMTVYHWFNKIVENIYNGKAWYHGLPSTWWYGMGILDFCETLPEYVLKEPEWISFIEENGGHQ